MPLVLPSVVIRMAQIFGILLLLKKTSCLFAVGLLSLKSLKLLEISQVCLCRVFRWLIAQLHAFLCGVVKNTQIVARARCLEQWALQ